MTDTIELTFNKSHIVTPEYRAFRIAMERAMADVRRALASLSDKKENRRASRALNEALDRVWQAIVKNPDCSPFGAIPLGELGKRPGGAAAVQNKADETPLPPLGGGPNSSPSPLGGEPACRQAGVRVRGQRGPRSPRA